MQIGAMDGAMAGQAGVAPQPRLVRAAHDFEAQMMKELLAPMTRHDSLMGDTDGEDAGSGTLGEFASEALAGALSAHGGFGMADRIVGQLSPSGNNAADAAVTGNAQIDTGMSTLE